MVISFFIWIAFIWANAVLAGRYNRRVLLWMFWALFFSFISTFVLLVCGKIETPSAA